MCNRLSFIKPCLGEDTLSLSHRNDKTREATTDGRILKILLHEELVTVRGHENDLIFASITFAKGT